MRVIKRNGTSESVQFDQITERITRLCPSSDIDPAEVAQQVCARLHDGITTSELDELSANVAIGLSTKHIDYGKLAARIIISNHHKNTNGFFSDIVEILNDRFSPKILTIARDNALILDDMIDHNRDFRIDYFGFKTLQKSYLLKHNDIIVERPQHLFLRVALEIHRDNMNAVRESYDFMSQGYFTHATPTLYHAGLKRPQMSSCFLIGTEDSVSGIFSTIRDVAMISKWAGGIGIHINNIRAKNSPIRQTAGKSDGILPMLKVYNDVARYINQSSRRNGSFAMYLSPWHDDIFEFLDAKKNHGADETRARDLFYALWIPDKFMHAVENDESWYLMCPDECNGLNDVWGNEFNEMYDAFVEAGKFRRCVKARDIWGKIISSQIETGMPYMLYADSCNAKSNQKNLGTIKSSNLCAEIVEFSDHQHEYAVCNLASIGLARFVENQSFDFDKFRTVVKHVVKNLDKVIERNFYPVEQTKYSNEKNRPIGLGVQGLADTYALMDIPFDSDAAANLNKMIFENMYYAALDASCELAEQMGIYDSYGGSPMSQGMLQFDLWGLTPDKLVSDLDWDNLRLRISEYGVRNSLLTALMPTASTSQILGYNECFEPFTSNMYTRRTLAGEFTVLNKYLFQKLIDLGLWTPELKQSIIEQRGSIQHIEGIPDDIKAVFKTAWEIKQRIIIDQAADRAPFICQSQSMNIFVKKATPNILTSIHFHGWKKGLKTGSYYIRSQPAATSQAFTVEPEECAVCTA